ncbi:dipeptide ABC transporter ATP-binding protein [Actinoalloteichus sp. GBA129-24]|uniref:dipeptide ABC transporter ATP-binding protein n=1 Tax=Actinoalloteichus sp. GBA129-24 TaxID=1612551 RepID=UPI00095087FA|nr:ABC transporter ATP-binding protein [Actinoalloteichus sp. GBA129-24]APU22503.1 ABC transporter [Actinoalloteichus sp. GBA129-24]
MIWRRRSAEEDRRGGLRAATVPASELRDPAAILDIQGLRTTFHTDEGAVHAVDGIDLLVRRAKTTCIVGESGSGKSATARSVIQVVDNPGRIEAGRILLRAEPDGDVVDMAALDQKGPAIRSIRGRDVGLVFQEPMSSLSPVHTIGNQISEMLAIHEKVKPKTVRDRVVQELERVGIPRPEERIDAYTFQLSGGMRQRAMIAMALACRPSLLIADEPTTALDVTTQAQILDLLAELKESMGMTMMFITHDLGVVAEIADEVVVMRHGRVVEQGSVDAIFHDPQAEYTKELLASLPGRSSASARRATDEPAAGEPAAAEPAAAGSAAAEPDAPERATRQPATPGPAIVENRDAPQVSGAGGETTDVPLLRIDDLAMEFGAVSGSVFGGRRRREVVRAVDGVSLDIPEGTTVGLVGESGCGKTTLGRCVMRAYQPTRGRLLYRQDDGTQVDLATLNEKRLLPYRRQIRMVFQDPYGSLNPRMTIRQVIGEPLRAAGIASGSELSDRVEAMLERVGLRRSVINRYPHAFSGGERQRIGIARALITEPRLVIADEAVSALDVSVRTQILELLADLQSEFGLTYLFISHDLSVVERVCDRLAVMYFGTMVEQGVAAEVFENPRHDYTRALLSAVPVADPRLRGSRQRIVYRPDGAESAA